MRRNLLTAIAGLVALSIAGTSQAAEQRQSAQPPPAQFHVDVATRPMSMARLVVQVPVGLSVGKFCYSIFCDYPQQVLSDYAFRGMKEAEYAEVFTSEAKSAAYNIAAATTDLFNTGDSGKPQLVVGAAITQFTANGKVEGQIITLGYVMDATMTVEWQVFDPLEKKIVYRGRSQGTAKVRNSDGPETLPREVARATFREASKAILMEAEFLAAVKDLNGGGPTQPGALFPEANNLAGSSPSSGGAVQIARLPTSTTPFRQHVKDLMKQVITVANPGSTGSGFYVADGLVLTNEHVISGYTDVRVKFFGGREIAGRVIASDARRDVALIRTESVGLHGLPLRTEQAEIASPIYVIGSPLDPKYEGSVISGVVSGFRNTDLGPMVQSDVNVTHGNSGGPMFDEHGNVIALVDIGIRGQDGSTTAVNLFIPIADALAKLNVQANLPAGAAPVLTSGSAQAQAAMSTTAAPAPTAREIKVSMFPAAGPVKNGGNSNPLPAVVSGIGTSGTFSFARPDGVSCSGRWTTLQAKPQSGSLMDKYRNETGLPSDVSGMMGGLAVGACSNSGSFQAEYYVVPNADSGFGAATDSDGNIYKLIF